jgi:hypothetical protein
MSTLSNRFLTTAFMVAASILLPGSGAAQSNEIRIDEGERPNTPWRTYGGACGSHQYEVAIWLGRPLSQSIREAKVDGKTYRDVLAQALREWDNVDGTPVDAVIDRCESNKVRVRLDVSKSENRRVLHFYYYWLDDQGNITLIGEK